MRECRADELGIFPRIAQAHTTGGRDLLTARWVPRVLRRAKHGNGPDSNPQTEYPQHGYAFP
jgi:hypothetical protein